MADYSLGYGGIGTGMDINGMVSQLVAADQGQHGSGPTGAARDPGDAIFE